MIGNSSSDRAFGIITLSIAECFGSQSVSTELATSLKKILPESTFVRATVRCGSGLFVTDDLLRPGYSMVSLVSLKYSLAGLAMKQGIPLLVRLPVGSSNFGSILPTRLVACVPISIPPPPDTKYLPLQIGALLVGSSEPSDLRPELKSGLVRLASQAGPAFLTVGLGRVQHLSDLLSLRDADAEYIGQEEDLQDLPIEVARPPSSIYGPPTLPLKIYSSSDSESERISPRRKSDGETGDEQPRDPTALPNFGEDEEKREQQQQQPIKKPETHTTTAATSINNNDNKDDDDNNMNRAHDSNKDAETDAQGTQFFRSKFDQISQTLGFCKDEEEEDRVTALLESTTNSDDDAVEALGFRIQHWTLQIGSITHPERSPVNIKTETSISTSLRTLKSLILVMLTVIIALLDNLKKSAALSSLLVRLADRMYCIRAAVPMVFYIVQKMQTHYALGRYVVIGPGTLCCY